MNLRLIRHLFGAAADCHPRVAEPVRAPLYDDFVRFAAPHAGDRVLDVGTGAGPIARRIMRTAPDVRSVVDVDIAHRALFAIGRGVLPYALHNDVRPRCPAPRRPSP